MSRRQATGGRNPVVSFVCTGRDGHKRRRLMVVELAKVAGVEHMDVVKENGGGTDRVRFDEKHGFTESYRMRCPVCGLDYQANGARLEGVVSRAVAADLRSLDISTVG